MRNFFTKKRNSIFYFFILFLVMQSAFSMVEQGINEQAKELYSILASRGVCRINHVCAIRIAQKLCEDVRLNNCATHEPQRVLLSFLQSFTDTQDQDNELKNGIITLIEERNDSWTLDISKLGEVVENMKNLVTSFLEQNYSIVNSDNFYELIKDFLKNYLITDIAYYGSLTHAWHQCSVACMTYLLIYAPDCLSFSDRTIERLKIFLNDVLGESRLGFNKDLTKAVYSIEDYERCWFGGDDIHQYC